MFSAVLPPLTQQDRDALQQRIPGIQLRKTGNSTSAMVPDHATALAWAELPRVYPSVQFREPDRWLNPWVASDPYEAGAAVVADLKDAGILRPTTSFFDYQLGGIGWGVQRTGSHLWVACGGGKTRTSFAGALHQRRPVIFCTRVAALYSVAKEARTVLGERVAPFMWLPPSRRRKSWRPVREYLKACRETRQIPFMLVGQENLAQAVASGDFAAMAGYSLVFDEIHRLKAHKRWDAIPSATGLKPDFALKDNTAAAAFQLTGNAVWRQGLTATPLADGRPRDLWAQLDLVEPKWWGNFYAFASRYCGARPGAFGGIDTSGTSRPAELQDRLAWVTWQVSREEVSAELPPLREEVIYLTKGDQQEILGSWKTELKQAARAGKMALLEARLAMSASRKRKWVVGDAVERMRVGQKVLIFTGRRKDAEHIAEAISKVAGMQDRVRWTHGAEDAETRQGHVDWYMEADTSKLGVCFVATGDSVGESLNLQDTDTLICVMLPYEPVKLTQWRGRVERPGQTRPVLVLYVVAEGTDDERIIEILTPKLGVVADFTADSAVSTTLDVIRGVDDTEGLVAEFAASLGDMLDWTIEED